MSSVGSVATLGRILVGLTVLSSVFSHVSTAAVPVTRFGDEGVYTRIMAELKADIVGALPALSPQRVEAYQAAIQNEYATKSKVDAVRKSLDGIEKARGLVGHAKNKWIREADQNIARATQMLKDAQTEEEKGAAQRELEKWQQNREEGVAALARRQAAYDQVAQNQASLETELTEATQAVVNAEVQTREALLALGVKRLLVDNRLDGALAAYVALKEAGPKRLAAFAQQGDAQATWVAEWLRAPDLLVQMLVADGAAGGAYGRALEIYHAIRMASERSAQGVLQRLALAVALEHAQPVKQVNAKATPNARAVVDPVKRYLHFEQAFLDGELDPAFETLSVWDLRMVVNGDEPDHVLAWGREMLRNYRPDLVDLNDYHWRYVEIVRSDIPYGSEENKYDRDELEYFQNILMTGGICGRRAFFGRFILRAFGIPTTARPQRGHAALVHWTPTGWVTCLGADWGSGWTRTPYNSDLDFQAATQARATGEAFMQVLRARWIGDVMGEKRVWGMHEGRPEFWNGLSLYVQRELIRDAVRMARETMDRGEGTAAAPTRESAVESSTDGAEQKVWVADDGSIYIPAAATRVPTHGTAKILFMASVRGGTQLHYRTGGDDEAFEYVVDVPQAGAYALTMNAVTSGRKQKLRVTVNGTAAVEMELPFTVGLWRETDPVEVNLSRGSNVLTFSRKGVEQEVKKRGFSLHEIRLTPTL